MRVALVTPVALPSVRGNAVTAGRLSRALLARGVTAELVDLSRTPAAAVPERLGTIAPDLVHALHAFQGAPAAVAFARERGIPLVVSLTGTDVNHDLVDPERRATTVASIRQARALVAFHDTIRARIAREVPEVAARIEVIPQSVVLEEQAFSLADLVPRRAGETLFLLPAGIRRVKNVLFPLDPLATLVPRWPLRLLLVGPVIEEREGARLALALKGRDWATHLGEMPHAHMAALLDQVDVVLNCSLSEGGMANSVLEAMSRGKPVLASDIEGNRSVLEDGVDGLLFASAEEFARQAERLMADPALRRRLGEASRAKVARLYPPEREAEAYVTLYRRLLGA